MPTTSDFGPHGGHAAHPWPESTALRPAKLPINPHLIERKLIVEFYVDGNRCPCDPGSADTLDDLLESVRQNNSQSNRAILGLVCDGVDVIGDELTSLLSKPATRFERVDVQTGVPNRMIAHALEEAAATLQTTEQERADVVSMFGQGKSGDAIILLGKCLGHWYQINEAISKSLALMGMIADSLECDLTQLASALQPVTEKLTDIRTAVKSQDYVALSDILEYEFGEVTTCWRDVIESILANVTAGESGIPSGAAPEN